MSLKTAKEVDQCSISTCRPLRPSWQRTAFQISCSFCPPRDAGLDVCLLHHSSYFLSFSIPKPLALLLRCLAGTQQLCGLLLQGGGRSAGGHMSAPLADEGQGMQGKLGILCLTCISTAPQLKLTSSQLSTNSPTCAVVMLQGSTSLPVWGSSCCFQGYPRRSRPQLGCSTSAATAKRPNA
jgi:hypothetical protein